MAEITFTAWFKEVYKKEWQEDYAGLNVFCFKVSCGYDDYYKSQNFKLV